MLGVWNLSLIEIMIIVYVECLKKLWSFEENLYVGIFIIRILVRSFNLNIVDLLNMFWSFLLIFFCVFIVFLYKLKINSVYDIIFGVI